MKNLIFISLGSILFGCQVPQNKTSASQIMETGKVVVVDKHNEIMESGQLRLDTTTNFQNKYFEIEDSMFFNLEKRLIEVSMNDDLGYVVFANDNDLNVALTKYEKGRHKIIGISILPSLKRNEELIQGLYPESIREFNTFGIVEINNDSLKTIHAWRINNKKQCIEQINPETVDFSESYNVDAD